MQHRQIANVSRRQFMKGIAILGTAAGASALLAACQSAPAPSEAPVSSGPVTNALGVVLPDDALPLSEQVWTEKIGEIGGGFGHIMESLYNRAFEHAGGYDTLTTLDKDFNVIGVGAESWAPSEDGSYWDFKLRKELVFSDGTPITAKDWVYTMRYSLSHNYDFGWYYFDIKNAQKVHAGELPAEELGMEAVDDYTLRIYTEAPVPYLPALFGWFGVAKDGIWEEAGENWALDPDRYISSGPFKLVRFDRDVAHEWQLNPTYKGVRRPYFTTIREEKLPSGLPAYMSGDINSMGVGAGTTAAELALIENNPVLKSEMHPQIATGTDYIGFNTTGKFPALDNPKVRLALCKAIDKANLVETIYQGFSYPAWGLIPTGFVNNQDDALRDLDPNVYDVEVAQALLAEAGYPGGEGFPTFELWIRQPNERQQAICEAIQARWRENLGITVELRPSDFQSFTSNLKENAPIYYVNYAMDYFDPATFLNVWRSTGRHPHEDLSWDEFYNEANSIMDDPERRFAQLREAEKRLVESTAWYFVHHPYSVSLWPCNLRGEGTEPNANGFTFLFGNTGTLNAREGVYWAEASCRADLA